MSIGARGSGVQEAVTTANRGGLARRGRRDIGVGAVRRRRQGDAEEEDGGAAGLVMGGIGGNGIGALARSRSRDGGAMGIVGRGLGFRGVGQIGQRACGSGPAWWSGGLLGRGPVGQLVCFFSYFILFPLFLFILSYFILVTFYFSFSKNHH